jgi:hypothetical protein
MERPLLLRCGKTLLTCAILCARLRWYCDPGKLTTHLWVVTPIVHEEFQGIRLTPNVYTTLGEIDTSCVAMEKVIRSGI